MSNTAPSRADPVVVFPLGRWCPPQETSQPHPPHAKYREVPVEWKKVYKQFQNWDTDSIAKVREILYTDELRGELGPFCNTDYPTSTKAATRLTSILQRAIHNVFPRKIKDRKPNKSKREIPYSHELKLAKRIYKKANRQYLNNRSNIDRRQNYLIGKRKYKKAIYKAKKIAQDYKLNRLADLAFTSTEI